MGDVVSDDERREVARRLRELHLGGGSKDLIERTLSDAIGAWRESGMSWDFITERLADLIEPDEPPYNLYTLYETVLHRSPRCWECIEDDEVDELVDALLDICNSPGHERIQRPQPSESKVRCVAEVKVDGEQLEAAEDRERGRCTW